MSVFAGTLTKLRVPLIIRWNGGRKKERQRKREKVKTISTMREEMYTVVQLRWTLENWELKYCKCYCIVPHIMSFLIDF